MKRKSRLKTLIWFTDIGQHWTSICKNLQDFKNEIEKLDFVEIKPIVSNQTLIIFVMYKE